MINQYIQQYGKRLYGLCLTLCTNKLEADDLYQDTCNFLSQARVNSFLHSDRVYLKEIRHPRPQVPRMPLYIYGTAYELRCCINFIH